MTDVTLIRRNDDYFVPATKRDKELLTPIKNGEAIRCKFTKQRKLWMHRKFFALLGVGYEALEITGQEYKGQLVEKNFERFRKDVTILAGYYTATENLKGDIRLEAKSIAFGAMGDEEFDELYYKVVDVLLEKVLTSKYDKDEVDRVVEEVMNFV